jgi:phosphatidate cytidylyltransferase
LLKTRILTALVIFPVTIACVFLPPPWLFRLLIAAVLMTGCWEFRRLADLAGTAAWILVLGQTLIIGLMMYFWPAVQAAALPLLVFGCLAWLLMFSRLSAFSDGAKPDGTFRWQGFVSALAATTFCWIALSWLHDQPAGPLLVFMLLLIIWASDVGAYFSGRQFGKRKLAPVISPKKTWEGVYGGIALAMAAAFLWSWYIAGLQTPAAALVAISVVTTLASVGGDLYISIHKRTVGLKDTGTLFPGHGGVLDRYDSLLSGAPFFALAFGLLAR